MAKVLPAQVKCCAEPGEGRAKSKNVVCSKTCLSRLIRKGREAAGFYKGIKSGNI